FQDVSGSTDRVDVFGKLEADSITALKGSTLVRFELVEEKSGERLAVLYDNPSSGLPANFPAASHARAAGTWDPGRGVFHSDRVLTKCPSKYEQERTLDRKTREAIARWQEQSGQLGS
ncbi:MAG: cytochrome c maturation protein CcmE, partial [Armatimonadetes bacterium]|nr:cytochrome c maturation protein CcmE [Armatimonadota bacterium]